MLSTSKFSLPLIKLKGCSNEVISEHLKYKQLLNSKTKEQKLPINMYVKGLISLEALKVNFCDLQ